MPLKDKEARYNYGYEWRKRNRIKCMYNHQKTKAKRKGYEFSISIEDIIFLEYCPVLGIKLDLEGYDKKDQDYRPSIDRRDNSKGYTKENTFLISGRANRLKSDATIEELEAILRYMKDV